MTTHFSKSVDLIDADAATQGLMLAGVLITATAAEINSVADLSGKDIPVTAATLVMDSTYNNKNLVLNRAAGITLTLPASSGSGATFRFIIQTTASGGSYIVKVANSSDNMTGYAVCGGTAAAALFYSTASNSDTVTMNGTTTGGIAGAQIVIRDIGLNLYQVESYSNASGTLATPFSATV